MSAGFTACKPRTCLEFIDGIEASWTSTIFQAAFLPLVRGAHHPSLENSRTVAKCSSGGAANEFLRSALALSPLPVRMTGVIWVAGHILLSFRMALIHRQISIRKLRLSRNASGLSERSTGF